MTSFELLRQALNALNAVPRHKLNGRFKDTYELAAEIGVHITAVRKAAPYPFCRTPEKCAPIGYCRNDPACND